MPRLFSAIELPDDVRADLRHLHIPVPGARWTPAADYHVSLRFAGDIDHSVARAFGDALADITADAFEIELDGVGVFGGDDPRLIYAGVAPNAALEALARQHEKAARAVGLPPEKRTFKPHVTLARLSHSRVEPVARYLSRFAAYRSAPIFISEFVLMSSRPQIGGGPYGVVERFGLRGGVVIDDDADATW
ncbi:MAG: RNA 2',3'-cyclic phosphodiesterase [Hyphomicrobium sp.]